MKKTLLTILASACLLPALAQHHAQRQFTRTVATGMPGMEQSFAAKATSIPDTLYNNTKGQLFDSSVVLKYDQVADSGFVFGMNAFGDYGFAERFNYHWRIESVVGVITYWSGTVTPSSTKALTMSVWDTDSTLYQIDTNLFALGYPGNLLDGKLVPFTSVQLGAGQRTVTIFNSPVAVSRDFYVGYNYQYLPGTLAGDSIGLRCTPDGKGLNTNEQTQVGSAYYVKVRNAVKETDGNYWYDVYNELGFNVNLSIAPILKVSHGAAVEGITRNKLTMYGAYPNPALNTANIDFALQETADVTVQLSDMSGKLITSVTNSRLASGKHSIALPVAALAAGDYVYSIRSSNGDMMASVLTVSK